MATTVVTEGQPGSRARFRDSFVLHKLMSLSGVFPIGFFMIQHLIANSYSLRGEVPFNTVVAVFGYLPFVAILEWAIVFIPILFHAIYGLFIVAEMQGPGGNVSYYNYGRNWLYMLQRYTGVIALAYILYHTYDTWGIKKVFELSALGGTPEASLQAHEAGFRAISYDAMMWRFSHPWYVILYIIGITAASFHLGNGLFNFCIRWGITVGNQAQKISAYLWSFVGVALAVIGIWTAINFGYQSQKPLEKFGGQTVTARFPTLDDLIKNDVAPANPTTDSKPVPGPGGVVNDQPTQQPTTGAPAAAPGQ